MINLSAVAKSYHTATHPTTVLKATTLQIAKGEFVGLVGRSGSGKSTLLNILSGIVRADNGEIDIGGQPLSHLTESELSTFRGRHIGIIFQFFQLIPTLNVLDNVLLAMDLVKVIPKQQRQFKARQLLESVGLSQHLHKYSSQLSGGEQQRVAVARALANDPDIVIADEPTGNLDSSNSDIVMGLLKQCAAEGRCVIVATHDASQLTAFSRVIQLTDGNAEERIVGENN